MKQATAARAMTQGKPTGERPLTQAKFPEKATAVRAKGVMVTGATKFELLVSLG